MIVGLVSDVHGNLPALEAVLADMPPVDALACAGDVVGYNPWPGECVDVLRERDAETVRGNHDGVVVDDSTFRFNDMARAGADYARERLTEAQLSWLADLPIERLAFDGRVKLIHGHPDDPHRYTYPEDFSPRLLGDEDVLVLGHTHVQHAERYAEGIVVNPGSVGQPRDGDPDAAYAIVDLDGLDVDLRRVKYDVETVRTAVAEAGLPEKIGSRLERGR